MAWALILLLIQVLVLDQVHPGGYGAPLICSLVIITLPLGTSRSAALLWGFIAFLLLLHHVIYFALEGFSYFHIEDIAISMGVSYAASLLLIILVEHVRNPKK